MSESKENKSNKLAPKTPRETVLGEQHLLAKIRGLLPLQEVARSRRVATFWRQTDGVQLKSEKKRLGAQVEDFKLHREERRKNVIVLLRNPATRSQVLDNPAPYGLESFVHLCGDRMRGSRDERIANTCICMLTETPPSLLFHWSMDSPSRNNFLAIITIASAARPVILEKLDTCENPYNILSYVKKQVKECILEQFGSDPTFAITFLKNVTNPSKVKYFLPDSGAIVRLALNSQEFANWLITQTGWRKGITDQQWLDIMKKWPETPYAYLENNESVSFHGHPPLFGKG